ncbi:MAG: hypothetical protein VB085_13650 [Peptococcaceae bacterium]|nr:hypothetical protein [Peptococcaceae bacterium]
MTLDLYAILALAGAWVLTKAIFWGGLTILAKEALKRAGKTDKV